tara:strand:- start:2914 stop:3393 length:480 start_codon:yes stop_codon:yes gene_type:complete
MSQIDNYSNYLIYNNGDIYSKKNKIFLKPRKDKDNYLRVDLCNDKKKTKTIKIHQLVAIAYLNHNLENRDYVIDHIDANVRNNYLHNLQRITRTQNARKKNIIRISGLPSGVYFTGIHFFCAIIINGCKITFNKFKTAEEASKKHDEIYNALMIGVKFE